MCKRFHFCGCADECPLKDVKRNFYKKPIITLAFKLNALVTCIKFDIGRDIAYVIITWV